MKTVWLLLILWSHPSGTEYRQTLEVASQDDCHASIAVLEKAMEKYGWNVVENGKPEVLCYEMLDA